MLINIPLLIILGVLWLIESKIHKVALKIGLLFVFVVGLSALTFYWGFTNGKSFTENDIFSEYAREFSDLTSDLYGLAKTNQYERLNKVLKVLKNELPAAIARHQYAFPELHNRLFGEWSTRDMNGQQTKHWEDPLDDLPPEGNK
jgi:hypothetical protein